MGRVTDRLNAIVLYIAPYLLLNHSPSAIAAGYTTLEVAKFAKTVVKTDDAERHCLIMPHFFTRETVHSHIHFNGVRVLVELRACGACGSYGHEL
jgi:hypothetical protein